MTESAGRETLVNRLLRKPIRVCQSLHECRLCRQSITLGQRYYDGGYGNRAHVECIVGKGLNVER